MSTLEKLQQVDGWTWELLAKYACTLNDINEQYVESAKEHIEKLMAVIDDLMAMAEGKKG